MARISLVICDLCKNQIEQDDVGKYEVSLVLNGSLPQLETGEACRKCYTALFNRLKSPKKIELKPKTTKKHEKPYSGSTKAWDLGVEDGAEDGYAGPVKAIGPSEEEKGERKATKELLEDELTKVPSRFNKAKATSIVNKARSKCPHHFKNWNDGKVICGPAPDGFEGELASFKGCGQALSAKEY